jgi:hypothetical protein
LGEGLTAGLLSLDPILGTDKDFGDLRIRGAKFYTSLLPWERDISRLDRMEPLLHKRGSRVAEIDGG